jgi:flagellar protein FliS
MNPYASPQAYRSNSVMTASPGQLVVMLYDGAVRFLKQAEIAMGEGADVHAGGRIAKAEAILDELLVTLDMERGGEIAGRLQAIYVFCKRLTIEARVEKDPTKLVRAAGLLLELREAFNEVAMTGCAEVS